MPIWDTAGDWDGNTTDDGTVHENVNNTDHNDAGSVKRGYSATNPYNSSNLNSWWPLHEDSGSTAYDVIGGLNGDVNGPSVGVGGLLGTTAYSLDGTDDLINISPQSIIEGSSAFTVILWGKPASSSNRRDGFSISSDSANDVLRCSVENGGLYFYTDPGGGDTGGNVTNGAWQHLAFTNGGSGKNAYIDGEQVINSGSVGAIDTTSSPVTIGAKGGNSANWDGDIAGVWVFDTYQMSQSEIQTHRDIVNTNGTFTSSWKNV